MVWLQIDMNAHHYVVWGGVKILEPMTVLTNFVISIVCFYAFYKMRHQAVEWKAFKWARAFFFLIGMGTILGGVVGHGFLYITGMNGKIPGWFVSMAGIVALERAAIVHASELVKPGLARFFSWFNIIEVITFAALAGITLNFRWVEAHALYGLLLIVFSYELFVYIKTKQPAIKQIFIATAWGLCALICHLIQWSPHKYFNYNDLSHLFMALSVWYYYKGWSGIKPISRRVDS